MKKIAYLLLLGIPLGVHAQLYVGPSETVTVLQGTDVFFGGVVADNSATPGLLDVRATSVQTNCVINGEITGDNRISFGDLTNLTLNNGTWSTSWNSPTENNEVLNNFVVQPAGFVEVPAGNSLTVSGTLTNTNTGTFVTLLADASGYGQLLTVGAVTNAVNGTMLAEQYLTADANTGWRQLSSPVTTTLAALDDDLTILNGTTAASPAQQSVFWYDAQPVGPAATFPGGTNSASVLANTNTATTFSSANAKHWTVASNNAEAFGPANNARAWNIYSDGSFPTLDPITPGQIDVTGIFGNGAYTFDCYSTHDVIFEAGMTPLSVDQQLITGWNLIPNPYPSNIDVSTLLADAANFDLAYKAVHVWNAKLQQYASITDGITIVWNTVGSFTATSNIAPFQAFWVKADFTTPSDNPVATENISVTNAHRTVEDNANFFKASPPLIRLNVVDADDKYRDQTILAFADEHQLGVESNDAFKLKSMNENVPSLYTTIEGVPFSINRLPNPAPGYSIPVFLESKKAGENYTFAMIDENIDAAWTIFLEDVKTGKMHNMRNGDYAFMHDATMKMNRFVVHINKFAGNIDVSTWNNVNIYANADGINVAFANPDVSTAEVTISNLAGQLIFNGVVTTGRVFTLPINDDIALYAVQVVTGQKVTHDKVVK